jgi:phenylacetate-CoA ligase
MLLDLSGKIHDLLSQNVLLPAGRLQGLMRPSRRPGLRAYYEGLRFRQQTYPWTLPQKRDWVLLRLRAVVRRAAADTVYYRELFERIGFDPSLDFGFDEFAQLPMLERENVHTAGKQMISSALSADNLVKDSTGGSTGAPTEVWKGPEERGWGQSGSDSFMRQIGLPEGTRTAYFWGHHLDVLKTDSLRERYHIFESNSRWFDCFRLSAEVLEDYHRQFSRWRPACIIAYSSALGSLAEYVQERGYQPNYPTHCLVTGAEKLLPHHRTAVEQAFGRPVHERYGSRDVGAIGFQLNPTQSLDYTVDWSNILVEPATAHSETDIIVTKLHADGMPMLRYRVGDIGKFPADSRTGSPTFALAEVLGRFTDRIWLRDGRWIDGKQLPHLMKDYPLREFMCLQRADYSVEIKVVPRQEFGEDSRKGILETVAANLPGLSISIELVDTIPRTRANKLRPVVTQVTRSQGNSNEQST